MIGTVPRPNDHEPQELSIQVTGRQVVSQRQTLTESGSLHTNPSTAGPEPAQEGSRIIDDGGVQSKGRVVEFSAVRGSSPGLREVTVPGSEDDGKGIDKPRESDPHDDADDGYEQDGDDSSGYQDDVTDAVQESDGADSRYEQDSDDSSDDQDDSIGTAAEQSARGSQQPELGDEINKEDRSSAWYIVTLANTGKPSFEKCGDVRSPKAYPFYHYTRLLKERLSVPECPPARTGDRDSEWTTVRFNVKKEDIKSACKEAFDLSFGKWANRKIAVVPSKIVEDEVEYAKFLYRLGTGDMASVEDPDKRCPQPSPCDAGTGANSRRGSKRSAREVNPYDLLSPLFKYRLWGIRNGVRPKDQQAFEEAKEAILRENPSSLEEGPEGMGLYLVNHTKKEYVQNSRLASSAIALTLWESPTSHGPWAGHELSIISAEAFEKLNDPSWRDAAADLYEMEDMGPEVERRRLEISEAESLFDYCLTHWGIGRQRPEETYKAEFTDAEWETIRKSVLAIRELVARLRKVRDGGGGSERERERSEDDVKHGHALKCFCFAMREAKLKLGLGCMAPHLFASLPAAAVIGLLLATSRELLLLAVAVSVVICLF